MTEEDEIRDAVLVTDGDSEIGQVRKPKPTSPSYFSLAGMKLNFLIQTKLNGSQYKLCSGDLPF